MEKTPMLYEEVTERGPHGRVLASNIRPPTVEEIDVAMRMHHAGNCPHTIVRDTIGCWMYDFRECAICGKGLGVV